MRPFGGDDDWEFDLYRIARSDRVLLYAGDLPAYPQVCEVRRRLLRLVRDFEGHSDLFARLDRGRVYMKVALDEPHRRRALAPMDRPDREPGHCHREVDVRLIFSRALGLCGNPRVCGCVVSAELHRPLVHLVGGQPLLVDEHRYVRGGRVIAGKALGLDAQDIVGYRAFRKLSELGQSVEDADDVRVRAVGEVGCEPCQDVVDWGRRADIPPGAVVYGVAAFLGRVLRHPRIDRSRAAEIAHAIPIVLHAAQHSLSRAGILRRRVHKRLPYRLGIGARGEAYDPRKRCAVLPRGSKEDVSRHFRIGLGERRGHRAGNYIVRREHRKEYPPDGSGVFGSSIDEQSEDTIGPVGPIVHVQEHRCGGDRTLV